MTKIVNNNYILVHVLQNINLRAIENEPKLGKSLKNEGKNN